MNFIFMIISYFLKDQIPIKPYMYVNHEMLISVISGFTFSELFPVLIILEPPIIFLVPINEQHSSQT